MALMQNNGATLGKLGVALGFILQLLLAAQKIEVFDTIFTRIGHSTKLTKDF